MEASKGGTFSNSWGGTETNSWKPKRWYQNKLSIIYIYIERYRDIEREREKREREREESQRARGPESQRVRELESHRGSRQKGCVCINSTSCKILDWALIVWLYKIEALPCTTGFDCCAKLKPVSVCVVLSAGFNLGCHCDFGGRRDPSPNLISSALKSLV